MSTTKSETIEAGKQLLAAASPFIKMSKEVRNPTSAPNGSSVVYARDHSMLTVGDFERLAALADNFKRMVNELEGK